MGAMIYELKDGDPNMHKVAMYTIPPKRAMVCYVKQIVEGNYNTFTYPETLKGMRESETLKDHWYYDLDGSTLAAYPA